MVRSSSLENSNMPRQKLYEDEKTVALSVRLPQTMYAHLQRLSKRNRRSMNQEIVWLIEKALERLGHEPRPEGK
jgi:Arc-like DNA binding domain